MKNQATYGKHTRKYRKTKKLKKKNIICITNKTYLIIRKLLIWPTNRSLFSNCFFVLHIVLDISDWAHYAGQFRISWGFRAEKNTTWQRLQTKPRTKGTTRFLSTFDYDPLGVLLTLNIIIAGDSLSGKDSRVYWSLSRAQKPAVWSLTPLASC